MNPARLATLWLLTGALAAAAQGKGPNTTIPVEKDRNRHDEFLKVAKAGGVDLLFVGDSITDGWRGGGKAIWDKYFAPLKAANFGISGDRTEHVIWRMRNGELEGIAPKLAVLMIGTNNGGDSAGDVALGIKTIISDIHDRHPRCKVLLLGIFPRSEKPDGARAKNDEVNKLIAKFVTFADTRRVAYLDIGAKFLAPDGTLPKDIMPDFLHPNEKGYQIWADAIIDKVKQMLQELSGKPLPSFSPPSAVARVAQLEENIAAGKFDAGVKALEKLTGEKDAKTADAAKASLAVIEAWKESVDKEIARLKETGDVFAAAELATGMGATYTGDAAKAYKEQAAELKKDAAYAAGKEYQKLAAHPAELRKDPRFVKLVEAFVKKYPDSFYAHQAQALIGGK
ncbi:MAG TPA: platelet-activating factor acetylhydrolase IB subunit [Planctomycetota bacterium]|nr:platelet-activating factor acetylhydrolase IB subunit [Planctomycetota bacterium]